MDSKELVNIMQETVDFVKKYATYAHPLIFKLNMVKEHFKTHADLEDALRNDEGNLNLSTLRKALENDRKRT